MKINLDNYIGSKPFLYGRDVLKRMEITQREVNEYDVADFLGYEVQEITDAQFQEFKCRYDDAYNIGDLFDEKFCAVSLPKENKMLIYANLFKTQKRITVFHESGHEILPWHIANTFSLRGKDIDPMIHKKIEQEAFLAGTEIMYPLKHFINDSLSLPLSFQSVKALADTYTGSFEATCIRYALTNQNIMALVVIKKNTPIEEQITFHNHHSNGQMVLPNMPKIPRINHASQAPLRVQYCTRSYRFPKYIKSGTEISEGNIIHDCWKNETNTKGEIHSSILGSSTPCVYQAECFYHYERVFVLLSLPDKELPLFFTGVN